MAATGRRPVAATGWRPVAATDCWPVAATDCWPVAATGWRPVAVTDCWPVGATGCWQPTRRDHDHSRMAVLHGCRRTASRWSRVSCRYAGGRRGRFPGPLGRSPARVGRLPWLGSTARSCLRLSRLWISGLRRRLGVTRRRHGILETRRRPWCCGGLWGFP